MKSSAYWFILFNIYLARVGDEWTCVFITLFCLIVAILGLITED